MGYLIQKRKGKRKGVQGINITIKDNTAKKTKTLTVHGHTLEEVKDKIYFHFYKQDYKNNQTITKTL